MLRLRFLLTVIRTVFRVLWRRWRHGPLLPSWNIRTEIAVEVMRTSGKRVSHRAPKRWRNTLPAAPRSPRLAAQVPLIRKDWANARVEIHDGRPDPSSANTLLYLHGGGYGVCSPRTHRALISRLTRAARCRTFAPHYRLAPEHPFPAAFEDVCAFYRQLLADGVAPATLAVAGDSAGGGLTLALLLYLRDEGLPLPASAVAFSPWVDLTAERHAEMVPLRSDYLHPLTLESFARRYAQDANRRDPHLSPFFGDSSGLPPLCIQAGGAEIFLPQIETFAQNAERAGVSIQFERYADMMHVWQGFGGLVPQGRAAIESAAAFLRAHWPALDEANDPRPASARRRTE